MTLEELKDNVQRICLKHKTIVNFEYGEDFLLATGKGSDYPMAFLEIPYNISYDLITNKFKDYSFSLCILMQVTNDDIVTDHTLISEAETIGDAIVTRITKELKPLGFLIEQVNGISLRNFSDDNVQGMRFELTGKVGRSFCANNYENQFSDL